MGGPGTFYYNVHTRARTHYTIEPLVSNIGKNLGKFFAYSDLYYSTSPFQALEYSMDLFFLPCRIDLSIANLYGFPRGW